MYQFAAGGSDMGNHSQHERCPKSRSNFKFSLYLPSENDSTSVYAAMRWVQQSMCLVPQSMCTLHVTLCTKIWIFTLFQNCIFIIKCEANLQFIFKDRYLWHRQWSFTPSSQKWICLSKSHFNFKTSLSHVFQCCSHDGWNKYSTQCMTDRTWDILWLSFPNFHCPFKLVRFSEIGIRVRWS